MALFRTLFLLNILSQVNGETNIPVGEESEPVLLNVTHGNPSHFSHGFPKNMTVAQLSNYISTVTDIPVGQMVLTKLVAKGKLGFSFLTV